MPLRVRENLRRRVADFGACQDQASKFRAADLLTPLGGRVICEDKDLLYGEAPQAYQDIDRVVADLVDGGVATVPGHTAPAPHLHNACAWALRAPRAVAP